MKDRRRDPFDPKDLILEAFRIDGISEPECRSIFVDWALSVPGDDPKALIQTLLDRHAGNPDDHPMKAVLREGLDRSARPGRKGGRRARVGDS